MRIVESLGHCGSEHCTNVDGHVEQAERGITLIGILGIIIQVTHQHLQVSLEQAGSYCNQSQSGKQCPFVNHLGCHWNGQSQITENHHECAYGDALAVTYFIGNDTTQQGHEIDSCKKNCIHLSGCVLIPAELGSHVESKDGKHGVVTESFACVGQCQSKQAFWLSLKHTLFID